MQDILVFAGSVNDEKRLSLEIAVTPVNLVPKEQTTIVISPCGFRCTSLGLS